jgi:hypothetical protein
MTGSRSSLNKLHVKIRVSFQLSPTAARSRRSSSSAALLEAWPVGDDCCAFEVDSHDGTEVIVFQVVGVP